MSPTASQVKEAKKAEAKAAAWAKMPMTREARRLSRIVSAPAPATVTAYACGQCVRVYPTKAEAMACCTCAECGTKFPRDENNRDYVCGHCWYVVQYRNAKAGLALELARLASVERDVREARARLDKLHATPRPARGSAPLRI